MHLLHLHPVIKEYASLLLAYAQATEERQPFNRMLNADSSINWTLADDSVRPVTANELELTYQKFFIRKAILMKPYQLAIERLMDDQISTEEPINSISIGSEL